MEWVGVQGSGQIEHIYEWMRHSSFPTTRDEKEPGREAKPRSDSGDKSWVEPREMALGWVQQREQGCSNMCRTTVTPEDVILKDSESIRARGNPASLNLLSRGEKWMAERSSKIFKVSSCYSNCLPFLPFDLIIPCLQNKIQLFKIVSIPWPTNLTSQ